MRRLIRRRSRSCCPRSPILGQSGAAQAQTPKPDPTARDVLLKQWTDIGEKVVKMAEEFPEDKYEFRPVAGVRTFGDNLRHVAFWNGYVAKSARGEKAGREAERAAEGAVRAPRRRS